MRRSSKKSFCAQFERESLVLRIVVSTRIEDERNSLEAIVGLPLAAKRKAIHAWQDDIADDEMRRIAACDIERRQSVGRPDDLMAATAEQLFERDLLGLSLVCNQNDAHAPLLLIDPNLGSGLALQVAHKQARGSMPMRDLIRTIQGIA